jgi:hypothetical protein
MKNLNPLYLTEGPVGDNVKLIKAFQSYIYPNRGNPYLFQQNTKILRDRYARKILDAKKDGPKKAKDLYRKLKNSSSYTVEKYRRMYGDLPEGTSEAIFTRFPLNGKVVGNY